MGNKQRHDSTIMQWIASMRWIAIVAFLLAQCSSWSARAPILRQESLQSRAQGQVVTPADASTQVAHFKGMFRGHFDNLAQVRADRASGLLPREGGGHEHIHCHLQPVKLSDAPADSVVLAHYYFDGQPERTFRLRLYKLTALQTDAQFGECVEMSIFRLRGEAEQQLRQAGSAATAVEWSSADIAAALRIPGCDVFWRWCGERFEGRMRTESITVDSPVLRKPIIVRDDVALMEDALWCNDRGTDMDGNYVYGNIHNVPYKMSRVDWACSSGVEQTT